MKKPKDAGVSTGRPPKKVLRHILAGNPDQNFPQQLQVQPLLPQGEFQLVEHVVSRVLGGGEVFHLPPAGFHQTPGTPGEDARLPPMRHCHHTEPLHQPLVSGGLALGDFHADLITGFRKQLQIENISQNELRMATFAANPIIQPKTLTEFKKLLQFYQTRQNRLRSSLPCDHYPFSDSWRKSTS
jgi:hypothetical protein